METMPTLNSLRDDFAEAIADAIHFVDEAIQALDIADEARADLYAYHNILVADHGEAEALRSLVESLRRHLD